MTIPEGVTGSYGKVTYREALMEEYERKKGEQLG